ncbi:unnamed protein product, partial [Ectocarpus sp. 8 AP-2014]
PHHIPRSVVLSRKTFFAIVVFMVGFGVHVVRPGAVNAYTFPTGHAMVTRTASPATCRIYAARLENTHRMHSAHLTTTEKHHYAKAFDDIQSLCRLCTHRQWCGPHNIAVPINAVPDTWRN